MVLVLIYMSTLIYIQVSLPQGHKFFILGVYVLLIIITPVEIHCLPFIKKKKGTEMVVSVAQIQPLDWVQDQSSQAEWDILRF